MKTAEEILKSKLDGKITFVNNPDYTFNKVIEAMEEYRLQSHPSPMSVEQVEELGYYYPLFKFFSDEHGLSLLDSQLQDVIHECKKFIEPASPSVKADGWVSVEDGLPEIPPPYYDKDNEVHKPIQGEVWCFDGSEVYEDWFYFNSKPVGCTHWKYKEAIPSPPKQK
jgi:hypothetical protein